MSTFSELLQKRTNIKRAITRHQNAVTAFKESDNILNLQLRLPELTELFKQYDSIQSEIESLSAEGIEDAEELVALEVENDKERSRIETQYFDTVAEIKTLLIKYSPEQSQSKENAATIINIHKGEHDSESVTNLKPIPLPKFAGKITNWFTFFDSFNSLVHEDKRLSNIRKFHYLRGCLEGDALRCIEAIPVSNDNYKIAIELLTKRFQNKRLIVQEHIHNILHLNTLTKSSHGKLRELLDTVNNNIASLKVLNLPIEYWDALLIEIIAEKLDFVTKREWQATLQKEVPTYQTFEDFLEKRCQIVESLNNLKSNNNLKNVNKSYSKQTNKTAVVNKLNSYVINKFNCPICKNSHNIYQCSKFRDLNASERVKQIEKLKLCNNCLRANHTADQCKSISTCKVCNQRHHSLLHFDPESMTSLHTLVPNQVLLSTALVSIRDSKGKYQKGRALLDQGSQANLITDNLCKKLGINSKSVNIYISGISQSISQISRCVNLSIKSHASDYETDLDCFVVPKITGTTPPNTFKKSLFKIPANITLADPNYNQAGDIDILIGAGLFWNLLIGKPIQLNKQEPYFQETKFGVIIGGNIVVHNQNLNLMCNHLAIPDNISLERQVSKFWSQEEIEPKPALSVEEQDCKNHFIANTVRAPCGKFVVKLPFKDNQNLGNSRDQALKRFLNLERKFTKFPDLKLSYQKFMQEYLSLKHMHPVPASEIENPKSYYLPHHAVFKQTVEDPKIRVVFDASAASSNKLSLNDVLLTGPTIHEYLFSILCRFRTHQFVFTTDIIKMYRMILVNAEDRNFQRILWRENPNLPIQTYRLATVTYGTTCAPFLAVRCLHQLGVEAREKFPISSKIIIRDFYMDDLLTGGNSIQEVKQIQNEIITILAEGGFNLSKWSSNHTDLIPVNADQSSTVNLNKDGDTKILGFHWNCRLDEFKYKFSIASVDLQNTTKQKSDISINLLINSAELPVMTKFSKFKKTLRVVAYCLRFINNCRSKSKNKDSFLSCEELEAAINAIIRYIQSRAFPEFFTGKAKKLRNNKLSKLDPFIDDNNLIRVGGRLRHAPINYDNKYPIILPKHQITKLIIKETHENHWHSGNLGTLAALRQKFWPLNGRNMVRQIIYNCIKCSRAQPILLDQKMADLPKPRFQTLRPFYNSGLDYAGPFLIKEGRTRSMRKVKCYLALFICFSTKAIHLELAGDLTTDSFLAAFKRFISRRGHVSQIFSDNGTNFTGAEREFFKNESWQSKIIDRLHSEGVKFNFIPPQSPHFGGLWESAVRSVKHHLYRTVGDASLTYEEFYTVITCIEACLNSRPITPLSSDPIDLEALTPGHILIGGPITAPIERDLSNIQLNRLSRWQRVQQIQQHFWKRWQKEYLSQLQERPRSGLSLHPNLVSDTLVALVEENLPPLRWRLGRITETHPGSDGIVRVVSVKTVNGVTKRAIKKCVSFRPRKRALEGY